MCIDLRIFKVKLNYEVLFNFLFNFLKKIVCVLIFLIPMESTFGNIDQTNRVSSFVAR